MIFFDKAAGFWFREKAVTAQAVRTSSKKTQPKMWQFPEQLPFFNILLAIILIFLCFKSLESIKDKVWSWWMHHPIFPLPPAGPGLRQRGACRLNQSNVRSTAALSGCSPYQSRPMDPAMDSACLCNYSFHGPHVAFPLISLIHSFTSSITRFFRSP